MQLNSQLKYVDVRRIRIADEAKDAFALSSSFNYQMNTDLLNSRINSNQPWNFDIPFAYASKDRFFYVFAGWISLQRPFQQHLSPDKMICLRVYEDKPRRLNDIVWQYVMHTLSRCHHRNFVLSSVAKTIELCPNSTLQKLTKLSISGSIESAVMTLCSEQRQPVRTQITRLARSKQVQGGGA